MLYWALVEQVQREHMSDEYKNLYIIKVLNTVAHILGLSGKDDIATRSSPTELAN